MNSDWRGSETKRLDIILKGNSETVLGLGGFGKMSPEELKDLKIMLATFKFDIKETVEEIVQEIITKAFDDFTSAKQRHWKEERIRRRERGY
jgi:hypothetical protein